MCNDKMMYLLSLFANKPKKKKLKLEWLEEEKTI